MGHAQPIQQAPGHPRFPCVTLSTNKQMKVKAVYKKKSQRTSLTAWNRGKKQVIKVHISWLCLWSTKVEQCVCWDLLPESSGVQQLPWLHREPHVPSPLLCSLRNVRSTLKAEEKGRLPFPEDQQIRGSGRVALTLPSSVSCRPFSPLLACSNSRPWAVDARVSTGCPSLPFCAGSSPQIPQCDSAAMGEST